MTRKHESYNKSKVEDRRRVVASAIESQRLEGLELDLGTLADLERFSSGNAELPEVRARIKARFSPA